MATAEQAQEAVRLHPRAASRARSARRPTTCASSTAAAVKPDERRRAAGARPDVDGALVGGAASTSSARSFAAIAEAAAVGGCGDEPAPSDAVLGPTALPAACVLVVLDGWGCAEPGPGNAIALARHAGRSTSCGRACPTRHARRDLGARRRACPTGQMGNSEVGHLNIGAGRGRLPGPDAHRRGHRRRRLLRQPRAQARRSRGPRAGRAAPDGPRVRRRGALLAGALPALSARWPAARASTDVVVHAFTDGRDTLPNSARRLPRARSTRSWRRWAWAGRLGRRPLLRDGPRQALGAGPARLRPARPRSTASTAPTAAAAVAARLRARRDRRVHRADRDRSRDGERRVRDRRRRLRVSFNFRPDRMPRDDPRPASTRDFPSSTRGPRRARIRRYVDHDPVRGGAGATRSPVRARAPVDHASPSVLAGAGGTSSTSPRPRSTRT